MEIQSEAIKVTIIQQNKVNPCDFIFNKEDPLQNLNQHVQKIGQSQNLYLGGVATLTAQEISKHKIAAVLTIMTERQKKKSKLQQKMQHLDDINRHITLMCDQDTPVAPYFKSAIQFIDDSFKYKMNVLVHCKDGDSKSATLVTAYLIYKYKTEFQQAYNIVKARRPIVNIKEAYMMELKQSSKKLRSMS